MAVIPEMCCSPLTLDIQKDVAINRLGIYPRECNIEEYNFTMLSPFLKNIENTTLLENSGHFIWFNAQMV